MERINMNKHELAGRIIIALDVKTKAEALSLISQLQEAVIFKVGLELFTSEGPGLIQEIQKRDKKVFLDLKLHDIPNTVAEAVRAGVRHGASLMTIHAAGGAEMMTAAAAAAAEQSDKQGTPRPLLVGVTVLTSLKDESLIQIGMSIPTGSQVLRLARLAAGSGMDGVVSSPQEIELLRQEMGRSFLIVTPGIRPEWASANDQKRIMTPGQAWDKGADYLVIGRPITQADSPAKAFDRIIDELDSAPGCSAGR
jgi:orotidine-5'-phosphate decarboxylase